MGNRLSVIDRLMTVTRVRVNVLFAYYVYRPITTCGAEKRKKRIQTHIYIRMHTYTHMYLHIWVRFHMYAYYWFMGLCERARSLGGLGESVLRCLCFKYPKHDRPRIVEHGRNHIALLMFRFGLICFIWSFGR